MNNAYQLTAKQYEAHFRTPDEHRAGGADPTLAAYLTARLKQIGVTHVMAIPGDYIAEWVTTLDDPQENPDPAIVRVHPNNEMCATYAADGYARATGGKGVGCVAFTYGVGALNAVQAVAGSTVESVPVVVINGSPSQAQFNSQRDQGVLWHHMFDGSRTDLRIFQEITEMAVRIDNPASAADMIDAALVACVTSSRPVYIEIANTLEGYAIHGGAQRLATRLSPQPVPRSTKDLDLAVQHVWSRLEDADRLVLLGGVEIARSTCRRGSPARGRTPCPVPVDTLRQGTAQRVQRTELRRHLQRQELTGKCPGPGPAGRRHPGARRARERLQLLGCRQR